MGGESSLGNLRALTRGHDVHIAEGAEEPHRTAWIEKRVGTRFAGRSERDVRVLVCANARLHTDQARGQVEHDAVAREVRVDQVHGDLLAWLHVELRREVMEIVHFDVDDARAGRWTAQLLDVGRRREVSLNRSDIRRNDGCRGWLAAAG